AARPGAALLPLAPAVTGVKGISDRRLPGSAPSLIASIPDDINPRRRVRGPGLHGVVGRVPSRGGTFGVMYRIEDFTPAGPGENRKSKIEDELRRAAISGFKLRSGRYSRPARRARALGPLR